MPFTPNDGFQPTNGVFQGADAWQRLRDSGQNFDAPQLDAQANDFAAGLNACVHRGGLNAASANLPMGGFKHTGVSDGSAENEYATYGQVRGDLGWVPSANVGGTRNAITLDPPVPITAYREGQRFVFICRSSNLGPTTVNVSGLGNRQVIRGVAGQLTLGDFIIGDLIEIQYDGSSFRFVNYRTQEASLGWNSITNKPSPLFDIMRDLNVELSTLTDNDRVAVADVLDGNAMKYATIENIRNLVAQTFIRNVEAGSGISVSREGTSIVISHGDTSSQSSITFGINETAGRLDFDEHGHCRLAEAKEIF